MSRNVTIMSCKGYKYVRVCESYRNAEGKPRSKVIENHGRLDQLEAKDPDYVTKLRERVRQENEAAKVAYALNLENAAQNRIRRLEAMSQETPDYGFAEPINIGSALLRQIWKEDLNLPQVFRYLQSKTDIAYAYDHAAFLLTSQRILCPDTFEFRKRDIIAGGIDDLNVVYQCLDRLSADKLAIIKHLNRAINKKLERSVTASFYAVTTYTFARREGDDFSHFGLSTDHDMNEVHVVMGLAMDEHGMPIDYDLFLDDASQCATKASVIERIRKDSDLKELVVVAAPGLNLGDEQTRLSQENIGDCTVRTDLETNAMADITGIHQLGELEDHFRMGKSALESLPGFAWTKARIEGYFLSNFISIVVGRYLRHVLKSKLTEIADEEIHTALRTALVAYDDGNPQTPIYLRLYSHDNRFDDMLRTFGLEPPCRYESSMSLRKKLRLKTIYAG